MTTISLLSNVELSNSLFALTFSRPDNWSYMAGQFARLGLDLGEEEPVFRAYSMSSSPDENTLSFLVKRVEGGKLSPHLTALKPGDTVLLDGEAQGNLLPERIPGGESLWFFATEAGLAPFLSLLKEKKSIAPWPHIVLALCARTLAEAQALAALARETGCERLTVVASTTREDSPLTGRLPALVENGVMEEKAGHALTAEAARVLLCGNPDFIKDMRALLKSRNMVSPRFGKPGQLLVESLW